MCMTQLDVHCGCCSSPAAMPAGYEVAAAARAARDRKDPQATIGHREGKNGVFDSATIGGAGGRRLLRQLGLKA